jgi:probable addiction module antidote protein
MNKVLESFPNYEDLVMKDLQDEEFQKEYLSVSLESYLKDGNFNAFFRALERVVKVRCSVTEFCKNAKIDRTNLYALIRGERKPQLETILKIFNELGFTLKVA